MKRFLPLVFLFAANTISGFAQGITMLAIPWYLVQIPDGKLQLSIMVAIVTLVSMFWGLFAGTLIDRYNRKSIFLVLNGIDGMVLCGASLLGYSLGVIPFWLIALVYTSTIFTYNVHYPNLYAFVQELFSPKDYARVNAAIEIQGQTTNFLGMMAGGLLLGGSVEWGFLPEWLQFQPWPLERIFLLDGGTYLASVLLISAIPYQPRPREAVDRGTVKQRLRQGWAYLSDHREIFVFGIASHVLFFTLLVMVHVAMPIYVHDYLGQDAKVLAGFKGLYALGALLAGLVAFMPFVRKHNLVGQIIFLLSTGAVIYAVLATTRNVPLALVAALLLGLANAGVRILRITYLVRLVPNRIIGRANSIFMVVNVLMRSTFIALLALPYFSADENGDHIVIALALLSVTLILAAGTLFRQWSSFDRKAAYG